MKCVNGYLSCLQDTITRLFTVKLCSKHWAKRYHPLNGLNRLNCAGFTTFPYFLVQDVYDFMV